MRYTAVILLLLFLSAQFAIGQMKSDWIFRKELTDNLLNANDTVFICNRNALEKCTGLHATKATAHLKYTTKANDKISIILQTKKFDVSKHKLNLLDTVYKVVRNKKVVDFVKNKNLIDGKFAYGIDGNNPQTEIKEFIIEWNNLPLIIPKYSFSNFYDIHPKSLEAYITNDQKLLYLYLSSSDGNGFYAVKYVFSKKGYVTRLISTNECTDGYDFIDALSKNCQ